MSLLFLAFLIFWISWDTSKEPKRLISLAGLAIYILLGFLFSKKRDQVSDFPKIMHYFVTRFDFILYVLKKTLSALLNKVAHIR